MDINTVFGIIFMVLQVSIGLYGLPDQIKELHRSKRSDNFSIPLNTLQWSASMAAAVYAVMIRNVFIFTPQILFLVGGGIVIGQIIYYRRFPGGMPAAVRAS